MLDWKLVLVAVVLTATGGWPDGGGGVAKAALPPKVSIAAFFDHDRDRKHELAFRYGIERINRDPNILPRIQIEPIVIPL